MRILGGRQFRRSLSWASLSPGRLRARVIAVVLIVLPLVTACSLAKKPRAWFGGDLPFDVTIVHDANENTPIAVDLIVVYDKGVLDQLVKLKASDWFAGREQFLKDHHDVKPVHWEWIPNQVVPKQTIEYGIGAQKVILFADYASDGAHREVRDPHQPFHLLLGTLDLKATP
jgi:hypothetical protein